MVSIYKFTLPDGNAGYIISENTNAPFLYKNGSRIGANGPIAGGAPDEEAITAQGYEDVLVDATMYKNNFNTLKAILTREGYASYVDANMLDYGQYFNIDNSACADVSTSSHCPKLNITAKSVPNGAGTRACVTNSYVDSYGANVYDITFYIQDGASGPQGVPGERGLQGVQGAIGNVGPQGSQGNSGTAGTNGTTPVAYFTASIYKRSNNMNADTERDALNAAQPNDTTYYYNHVMERVSDLGWSDSIPEGTEEVWMSRKTFTTDDNEQRNYNWSKPVSVYDSETTDFEWKVDGENLELEDIIRRFPPLRTSPNDANPGTSYDADGKDPHGWYDNPVSGAVWMAIREIKNGVYVGDWEISRIKGEDGDAGTSLDIRGNVRGEDLCNMFNSGNNMDGTSLEIGDSYVVSENFHCDAANMDFMQGHIYIWDGDSWVDGGMFSGESTFVHIKYANKYEESANVRVTDNNVEYTDKDGKTNYYSCISLANKYREPVGGKVSANTDYPFVYLTWTDEEGETPNGDFIGVCTDINREDPFDMRAYKWTYAKGEDGFGYEYIYCLTTNSKAPDAPTGGTSYIIGGQVYHDGWTTASTAYQTNSDFVPQEIVVDGNPIEVGTHLHWTDNLVTPTKAYPFAWECYRRKNGSGEWSGFIGDANEPGKAALRGRYVQSPEFVSTIFKRSNYLYASGNTTEQNNRVEAELRNLNNFTKLNPNGRGTYDNPVPSTPEGWYDAIPAGDEVLWMSHRTFTLDVFEMEGKYIWSKPALTDDSADIDFEWCAAYEDKATEAEMFYGDPEHPYGCGPLRTSPDDEHPAPLYGEYYWNENHTLGWDENKWYDSPISGAVWLAACNVYGGVYERNLAGQPNWRLSKIKGESGQDGKDADASIRLDLTNEVTGLGVGGDAILDVPSSARTYVYFIKDEEPLRPENVYVDDTLPEHVTIEVSESGRTPEQWEVIVYMDAGTDFTQGSIELMISADYNGNSYDATMTIMGIKEGKDGAVFALAPSVDFVFYDKQTNNSYAGSSSSNREITCKAYLGSDELDAGPDNNKPYAIAWSTGETLYDEYNSQMQIANSIDYSSPNIEKTSHHLTWYLFMRTGSTESDWIWLDREELPCVCNGLDGEGSVTADLTNEMDGVGIGEDGELNSDVTFETTLYVFSGSTKQKIRPSFRDISDNIPTATTATAGKVSYTTSETSDNGQTFSIRFWGTQANGIPFANNAKISINLEGEILDDEGNPTGIKALKTFTVAGYRDGVDGSVYRLVPSVDQLILSNEVWNVSAITCSIELKNKDSVTPVQLDANSRIFFEKSEDGEGKTSPQSIISDCDGEIVSGTPSGKQVNSFDTSGINIENTKSIIFYYLKKGSNGNDVLYDRESIPIIRDGHDGEGYLVVSFTNDSEAVALGDDHILDSPATASTIMTVYSGSTCLKITGMSITPQGDSANKSNEEINNGILSTAYDLNNASQYVPDSEAAEIYIYFAGGNDFTPKQGTSDKDNSRRKFRVVATVVVDDSGTTKNVAKDFVVVGLRGGVDGKTWTVMPSSTSIRIYTGVSGSTPIVSPETISAFTKKPMENEPGGSMYYILGMANIRSGQTINVGSGGNVIAYTENRELSVTAGTVGERIMDYDAITFYYVSGATGNNTKEIIDYETVNILSDARAYRLILNTNIVHIDKDGNYNPPTITCDKTDSSGYIYYQADNNIGTSNYSAYTSPITVTSSVMEEAMVFYYTDKPITDTSWTLLDQQRVTIVRDGVDGDGWVVVDLLNNTEGVGVGSDYVLSVAYTASTKLQMFVGGTPVYASIVSVTQTSGVSDTFTSGVTNNGALNPEIKIGLNANARFYTTSGSKRISNPKKFEITATGQTSGGQSVTGKTIFTILGVKEGEDGVVYKLNPTSGYIMCRYDESEGNYVNDIAAIACSPKPVPPSTGTSVGDFRITGKIDNKSEVNIQTNDLTWFVYNWTAVSGSSAPKSSVTFTYYYKESQSKDIELDKEVIPVIRNGKDGKDGVGWGVVDIDNDFDTMLVGPNGILDATAETTTNVRVYFGTTEITSSISNITVTRHSGTTADSNITFGRSGTTNTVKFTMANGTDFNGAKQKRQYDINVTATTANGNVVGTRTYTLVGSKNGKDGENGDDGKVYKLIPSVDVIRKNKGANNQYVLDPTTINATKQLNGESSSEGKIYYKYTTGGTSDGSELPTNGLTLDSSKNLVVLTWKSGSTVYDRETIPIIQDGEDGSQGGIGPIGPQGDRGSNGVNGSVGPSIVYRGDWNSTSIYYHTDKRVDVVRHSNLHYMAVLTGNTGFSGSSTKPTGSDTSNKWWEPFGAEFESVATKILVADRAGIIDATIARLSTAASGARIEAAGNHLTMFDNNGDQRLLISGNNLSSLEGGSGQITSQSYKSIASPSSGNYTFGDAVLFTFTVGNNITNAKLTISNLKLSLNASGSYASYGIYLSKGNTTANTDYAFVGEQSITGRGSGSTLTLTGSISKSSGSTATYSVCVHYEITYNGSVTLAMEAGATASWEQIIRKTEIAANGFRTAFGANSYAEFIADTNYSNGAVGMYTLVSGDNGVQVSNAALKFKLGGTWYTVNKSGTSITLS